MADKLDPFDVEALESAVNDSATRVSAIWISFLVFSLYLLIAATTVTQRQLLLADPIKLPVLNIELPLWGFFFLAPILFVILHAYVLLQVLLLGRTTAAYNDGVARLGLSPEENVSLRQRLANTLFAQIFAGSPREREGFIGWLLRAIVWITLAIAPILIVLAFQFSFLAYHSHIATWTHRLLMLVELAAFFLIWPRALDAQKDFQWPKVRVDLKHWVALSWSFLGPYEQWHTGWPRLRQRPAPLAACFLFIIVSLSIATFPGEPHVNLFTWHAPFSVQCDRWLQRKFDLADLRFDRLDLPHVDVIDHEKLDKIEDATRKSGELPYQGERTRILRDRDLNCSDFSNFADMRRVDFTGSRLRNADLASAKLEGTSLDDVQLQGAYLDFAQLQGASLDRAQLQHASLNNSDLKGASLDDTELQGAQLIGAELQGTSLYNTYLQGAVLASASLRGAHFQGVHLQGASLDSAHLQGATFFGVWLQGASLDGAQLQGVFIKNSELEGASLLDAQLQGASFDGAQLQGTSFDNAQLTYARFSDVFVWRAKNAACQDSHVSGHRPDATIAVIPGNPDKPIQATPDEIAKFVDGSVADISDTRSKESARARLLAGLVVDPANDDTAAIEAIWRRCEDARTEPSMKELDQKRVEFLRGLVCDDLRGGQAIAKGIVRAWNLGDAIGFSGQLARDLLGQNGKQCAATKNFDEATLSYLRAAANAVPTIVPTK